MTEKSNGHRVTNGNGAKRDPGTRFFNLFIGGGLEETGLRQREDEEIQASQEHVCIRFVDSDPDHLEELPEDETLLPDPVRAADLLDSIAQAPEKFPGSEYLGDLKVLWKALGPAGSLSKGLRTKRILGLLMFLAVIWRQHTNLRNFLLGGIRELHSFQSADCVQRNRRPRRALNLVRSFFFSSCGGTGSSLSLLLEAIQRFFLNMDLGLSNITSEAHILLPGPMLHRANDFQALKANTWAFFLELQQRYVEQLPALRLGPFLVPFANRPFGRIYLYDEGNAKEQIFTSRPQTNDAVNESWKFTCGDAAPRGMKTREPSVFICVYLWLIFRAADASGSGRQGIPGTPGGLRAGRPQHLLIGRLRHHRVSGR